jgi:hypothetical protein
VKDVELECLKYQVIEDMNVDAEGKFRTVFYLLERYGYSMEYLVSVPHLTRFPGG